ncbi:hypothetical protein DesLBE_1169 [Desulfitobacterium sp. LBE]|nr:hypothetical protein DesLBE_1169 [Desulfitobacterium sp. LBE]
MCFRPPSAGKKVICEACGTPNPEIVKNCIKCKAELKKDAAPPKEEPQK